MSWYKMCDIYVSIHRRLRNRLLLAMVKERILDTHVETIHLFEQILEIMGGDTVYKARVVKTQPICIVDEWTNCCDLTSVD